MCPIVSSKKQKQHQKVTAVQAREIDRWIWCGVCSDVVAVPSYRPTRSRIQAAIMSFLPRVAGAMMLGGVPGRSHHLDGIESHDKMFQVLEIRICICHILLYLTSYFWMVELMGFAVFLLNIEKTIHQTNKQMSICVLNWIKYPQLSYY